MTGWTSFAYITVAINSRGEICGKETFVYGKEMMNTHAARSITELYLLLKEIKSVRE